MATRAKSSAESGDDVPPTGANTTFSLRLRPKDYRNLHRYANLRQVSIAEIAREFILQGLRNALDPVEIERQMEAEKQRLLAYARELRDEDGDESPSA
ncbi:hypothetical protein [Nocardia sp. NPDC057353]|uniref:hypothetical protein n=1 Tax=Nocardia sp. NPDC057353 TaxID=3346104 RepID=UPI00362B8477